MNTCIEGLSEIGYWLRLKLIFDWGFIPLTCEAVVFEQKA
jgi:hypothetical protein